MEGKKEISRGNEVQEEMNLKQTNMRRYKSKLNQLGQRAAGEAINVEMVTGSERMQEVKHYAKAM